MPPQIAQGGIDRDITLPEQEQLLTQMLDAHDGPLRRVLLIPPDHTRLNSGAGEITQILYRLLTPQTHVDVLPALGTHKAMKPHQTHAMFKDVIPHDNIIVHDWENGLDDLGEIPGHEIAEWTEGKLDYSVKIQINKLLTQGNYDLILSIGQIVPHEVVGMANYTKNICVGVGGSDTIDKSHFIGAVHGMERIMGRADSPPRRVFNEGARRFLSHLPITYILTVREQDFAANCMRTRGLYIGNDDATFEAGVKLAQQANIDLLDKPITKAVVYLDPEEFSSTWLGNKAIYRTRMAIADGGELIILAPALDCFGEADISDYLIAKYGYRTTDQVLQYVKDNQELQDNRGAAAHLIHGSSEGRFTIRYCPGPGMSRQRIESVGYQWGDLDAMTKRYDPAKLNVGPNTIDGEEIFYIPNPALGLWALREKFI